jgi:hypothetical protein
VEEIAAFHLASDGHESRPHPEDVVHFQTHLARLDPLFRELVFDSRAGWERTVDLKKLKVSFSLWAGNRVGFVFGANDPAEPDFYIGVQCNRKPDGAALSAILAAHRREILRHIYLPREFSTPEMPVVSTIRRMTPASICRRLMVYRTVLSPFIDQISPRRGGRRSPKSARPE